MQNPTKLWGFFIFRKQFFWQFLQVLWVMFQQGSRGGAAKRFYHKVAQGEYARAAHQNLQPQRPHEAVSFQLEFSGQFF